MFFFLLIWGGGCDVYNVYGLQGNWDFAGSYSGILFGLIFSYDN